MSPQPRRPTRPPSRAGSPSGRSAIVERLESVRRRMVEAETHVSLDAFGDSRDSARNLLHYLVLRGYDLRDVQARLTDLGLSSLGRAEGHVLHNLDAVLARLDELDGGTGRHDRRSRSVSEVPPERGRMLLGRNVRRLFGAQTDRATRIMVTLPTEAASDPTMLTELLRAGTDVVRINCAHDTEREWTRMAQNLRRARRAVRRTCRLEMDLGGPRLRTGPIEPGPAVLRVRPRRDGWGRSIAPAVLELVARPPEVPGGVDYVTVPSAWLARRRAGERLTVRDVRGNRRSFRVRSADRDRVVAIGEKSAYLTNGLVLHGRSRAGGRDPVALHGIPPQPGRIRLGPGSRLLLAAASTPGWPAEPESTGTRRTPTIGVSHPDLLGRVSVGNRVWFDGGRLGGVVERRTPSGLLLDIRYAPPGGTWLRADQGINLPDTDLGLPPLLEEDRRLLPFLVRHADLVGFSFVESAEGISELRRELVRLGRPAMGIVLKIETRRAFERLPEILLSALANGPTGVMVARGDLAVEVGFERLAEVQEEILWLCEAAHLPAIWATQVLEGLAKSGMPSRAEVTDAAMGERAECVMLNKGPYLVEAVRALDGIVRRMEAHQEKKSARLRLLHVAERFLAPPPNVSPGA